MRKVLVTTVPFGDRVSLPLDLLEAAGVEYVMNPLGRKLKEDELAEMVGDFEVLIAGTEPITEKVMSRAPGLRMISRVGIGLDSVDLLAAERRGITVSYTPDAPAPAVAELTIGLMFSLMRSIHVANVEMHMGEWRRHFGRRVSELTIGVMGAGRIGKRVLCHLAALGAGRLLVNDTNSECRLDRTIPGEWVEKDALYRGADIVSLHVPLTAQTKNMVRREQLLAMKHGAMIVNTARGGIINERELADVLRNGHLSGAALDVFCEEPYSGELSSIQSCLLTSHMGSMSADCRTRMEIEATEEAIRFLAGAPLRSMVPPAEYQVQWEGL